MTTDTMTTDDTDQQKPTKHQEQQMKELEHFAQRLKEANLLYGSALDGMKPGLKAASDALTDVDMDAKMDAADEEVYRTTVDKLTHDVDAAEELEREMQADDDEEEALLTEDEAEH